MREIPEAALKELAGSLCSCGGVHISSADTAIIALSIAEATKTAIPWCDCEGCDICKTFRDAVGRILAASARLDNTPHNEDSL